MATKTKKSAPVEKQSELFDGNETSQPLAGNGYPQLVPDAEIEEESPAASAQSEPVEVAAPMTTHTQDEIHAALLALSFVEGLGRYGIRALYDSLGGLLNRVWECDAAYLSNVFTGARVPKATIAADYICYHADELQKKGLKALEDYAREGIYILTDEAIPPSLRSIPDYPRWLFVQGDTKALFKRPIIAVVGTREPSLQGRRATATLMKALAPYPVTIVSGLAMGIDEEARRHSLTHGKTNVAFLGHGIEIVFPASTADLREQIVFRGGAVVTESLPREPYSRSSFVQRNRLQAALCDVLIPVESQPTGGTVHTVKFAIKYHKQVLDIRINSTTEFQMWLRDMGCKSVALMTSPGRRELDAIIQMLGWKHGQEFQPLEHIARSVQHQVENRYFSRTQAQTFLKQLEDLVMTEAADD